jgi:transcriptional regulator with XRE-family HTH domain
MADDFAAKVAARIKELREARGMSLRQLSRRSGVAPESVSRSERARSEVSLTNLARIARGLGVSIPEFFDFARTPDTEAVQLEEDAARVVALVRASPPARRARVVAALELLLEDASPAGTSKRKARRTAR